MVDLPYRITASGLELTLRATPNAKQDQIIAIDQLGDGRHFLKLRIRAVPEKGKANKAIIGFIAKTLGVPKSSISMSAGSTSRLKTLQIDGNGPDLAVKCALLCANL